ncbi:hypothetical protein [Streptomyces sp. Tue6028]|uniref:hypothetical protein n=1 Tax=Streptomyces sp. Tue6028 TaxID=2036037 RepID=UPI003D71C224
MTTSQLTITTELIAAWSDIQRHNADLPDLAAPEDLVKDTSVACGPRLDFDRLLHEAAHGLAAVRGIRDTSRAGRYHNRRFLALAREVGLVHWGETAGPRGFSTVRASPATRIQYQETIERWDQAMASIGSPLGSPFGGPASRKRSSGGGKRVKAACGCGRILYVVLSVLVIAPITCQACQKPFLSAAELHRDS